MRYTAFSFRKKKKHQTELPKSITKNLILDTQTAMKKIVGSKKKNVILCNFSTCRGVFICQLLTCLFKSLYVKRSVEDNVDKKCLIYSFMQIVFSVRSESWLFFHPEPLFFSYLYRKLCLILKTFSLVLSNLFSDSLRKTVKPIVRSASH